MLEKTYDPKPVEAGRLLAWEQAKLSLSKPRADRKPFTIVIPPPNVTGVLHIGHALNNSLQDVLIRHRRMSGDVACWVPGTDHGGIATQNVMEKQLKAESTDRQALGREKFLERMQAWTRDCKKKILDQLRRLGCSLDWSREAFTMDEPRAQAVYHAFRAFWEKEYVYRGERLVNWCVRCGTALSDIEVEREERKGGLFHIQYRLEGGADGIVVATTRPETMFGDTAVAVNPKDKRWTHLVGKNVLIPLIDRAIPVIEDAYVEFEFGTGGLKVTPAHDQNDWEIGQRHKLPAIKAIDQEGRLTAAAGPYAGLSREQGRDKTIADLEAKGFLVKKEDHRSAVQTCYRCGSVIEPLLSLQWFLKQTELAKPALKALDDGQFKISPENWAKPYRDWLVGMRDWCVSRQIWWGHRIPVWYCLECHGEKITAVLPREGAPVSGTIRQLKTAVPEATLAGLLKKLERINIGDVDTTKGIALSQDVPGGCPTCKNVVWVQDPDVLDTWFSSALWPLSVFGWPDKNAMMRAGFDYYYPTSTLVTGYEILYLWVARMQMMGLFFEQKVPFADALIHGIVRDKSGKKMSKSLGNVVDPLEMMEKYGTDALRFALLAQAHPGKDIAFDEQSVVGARNFVNKLWNSARLVLMNLPELAPKGGYKAEGLARERLELADRWILSRYQATLAAAAARLDASEPAAAAELLYAFLWDDYCAWYIELAKARLQAGGGDEKEAARAILVAVLVGTLKALHPLAPFVTEELYLALKPYSGETADFIVETGYAKRESAWADAAAEAEMARIRSAVDALRSLRGQLNVPVEMKIKAVCAGPFAETLLGKHRAYLSTLARLETLEPYAGARPPHSATAVADGATFYVPLAGVVDFAKERERLTKDLAKAEGDIEKLAAKLKNLAAAASAPAEKVAEAKAQHEAAAARRERLKETLAVLS